MSDGVSSSAREHGVAQARRVASPGSPMHEIEEALPPPLPSPLSVDKARIAPPPRARACPAGASPGSCSRRQRDLQDRRGRDTPRTWRDCRRARCIGATGRAADGLRSAGASTPRKSGARSSARCSLAAHAPGAQMRNTAHEAGIQMLRRPAARGRSCLRIGVRDDAGAPRCARRTRARRPRRGRPAPASARPATRYGCDARPRPPRSASASHSAPRPPSGCANESPAALAAASRYSSVNTVPGERGPKLVPSTASKASAPFSSVAVEVLLQQIVHIHAADAQQLAHVAPAEPAHPPARASAAPSRSRQSPVPSRGGACVEQRLQGAREALRIRAR